MSSNICNIVNKFMNESGKEIFLIAAIAVVLYLILTYSSKPRVTANTMPNVTDSEIAEPFNEDDLFNTPANIPLAFDDAEPALITQPLWGKRRRFFKAALRNTKRGGGRSSSLGWNLPSK